MSSFGYPDYERDRSRRRDRNDFPFEYTDRDTERGQADRRRGRGDVAQSSFGQDYSNSMTDSASTFDYGHGQNDPVDQEWTTPRGRERSYDDRRVDQFDQLAHTRAGLLETPPESHNYYDRPDQMSPRRGRSRQTSPSQRSRSPLASSRYKRDDFSYRNQGGRDDYFERDRPIRDQPIRGRSDERRDWDRFGPQTDDEVASYQPAKTLLPDPKQFSSSNPTSLDRVQDPYFVKDQSYPRNDETFHNRPALLPEPDVNRFQQEPTFDNPISNQDSYGQPALGAHAFQTQKKMEQTLHHSRALLQKLERKSQMKNRKLDEMERDLHVIGREERLRELGVVLKPKGKPANRSTRPRESGEGLTAEKKRQLDEELRKLGVVSKNSESNRSTSRNRDEFQPDTDRKRLKNNDQSYRNTGFQDRNKSPNMSQRRNDRRSNDGWTQDEKRFPLRSPQGNQSRLDRNDRQNKSRSHSKERPNIVKSQPKPQQQSRQSDDDDIIEIPVELDKPGSSEDQDVQLIVDTIRSRFTTLEPSKIAVSNMMAGRTQLWKRNADTNIALSQFSGLLKSGENFYIQLCDRVIKGLHCYTCNESFPAIKAYYNHERGYKHKTNWAKVKGDPVPVKDARMQVLKRLAVLPSIFCVNLGGTGDPQTVSMRQDLIGCTDYYFICRVCHDVYRGPAELHFKTATHINQEKKKMKCVDCKVYFMDGRTKEDHYRSKVHKKVAKQGSKALPPAKTAPQSTSKTPPKSSAPSPKPTASPRVEKKPQNKSTATMGMSTSGTYTLTTSHFGDKSKTSDTKGKSTQSMSSSGVSSSRLAVSGKSNTTSKEDAKRESSKQEGASTSKQDGKHRTKAENQKLDEMEQDSLRREESLRKLGVVLKPKGKPANTPTRMISDLKRQIPKILKANPKWTGESRGINFTIPVVGFFCKVCGKFYNEKKSSREEHCSTLHHQLNMKVFKLTQDKDKKPPVWMDSLPGMSSVSQTSTKPEVLTDDTQVVDMDVQTPDSSPDTSPKAEETCEWFEGDLTL